MAVVMSELSVANSRAGPPARSPLALDELALGGFAVVLLVAAALKADATLHDPLTLSARTKLVTQMAATALEWCVAAWLLSGFGRVWAGRAAIGLLVVFIAVAGWSFFAGKHDCGCFGSIPVHPGLTLALDLAALSAIVWTRPRPEQQEPFPTVVRHQKPSRDRLVFTAVLCSSLPAAIFAVMRPTADDGPPPRVVTLDPRSMRGAVLPLLEWIDPVSRNDLLSGHRKVIVFDRRCEFCRSYLSRLSVSTDSTESIRLIDIAPAKSEMPDRALPHLRQVPLRNGVLCAAEVPLEITLFQGVVQAVRQPARGE